MSPLLNYTTTVDVSKTVGEIFTILTKGGARRVEGIFDAQGDPIGVSFGIETLAGQRDFTLPVFPDRVRQVMQKDPRTEPRFCTPEQAKRVAWRIAKDWLEAQLALVATEMVTFEQVMLSYMHLDGERTVYQLYIDKQLAALTTGP